MLLRATTDTIVAFEDAADEAMRELGRHKVAVIDAAAEFNGRRDLFADLVHFNDDGAAAFASYLAARLQPILLTTVARQACQATHRLMLFNSFVFLLLFLPVTYTVFWMLRTASVALRLAGGDRLRLLRLLGHTLLLADGLFDARQLFCRPRASSASPRRWPDGCAWSCRLPSIWLLGFFKYANFGNHARPP